MGYKIRGNRIYVTGTVDGKHYRLSTGKEATELNIAWIRKNHRDVLLKLVNKEKPKPSMLFAEYAERSMEANAYAIRDTTHKQYGYFLNKHILPYFRHYRLDEIKPSDIKHFQSRLLEKLDARSARNVRALLGKILNDAVLDELIDKNPVDAVKAPRLKVSVTKEVEPFTLEEVETLIKNASGFYRNFLVVAFFTGMRLGEIVALRWEDVDFDVRKIYIKRAKSDGREGATKTGKARAIDMLDIVRDALSQQRKQTGLLRYVFVNSKNRPFQRIGSIKTTYWDPLLRRCGIRYRVPYNTRHTFASLMLRGGEDILWVSKMLGHTTVATTMKYYTKFVEERGAKRATFLDDLTSKNRTLFAQSETATPTNTEKRGIS